MAPVEKDASELEMHDYKEIHRRSTQIRNTHRYPCQERHARRADGRCGGLGECGPPAIMTTQPVPPHLETRRRRVDAASRVATCDHLPPSAPPPPPRSSPRSRPGVSAMRVQFDAQPTASFVRGSPGGTFSKWSATPGIDIRSVFAFIRRLFLRFIGPLEQVGERGYGVRQLSLPLVGSWSRRSRTSWVRSMSAAERSRARAAV